LKCVGSGIGFAIRQVTRKVFRGFTEMGKERSPDRVNGKMDRKWPL
jgi:hypothetical protein